MLRSILYISQMCQETCLSIIDLFGDIFLRELLCTVHPAFNTLILIRIFLTRFSTPDWFSAMLKISTEHGSGVSVGKCVSEIVSNIENIKRKVVLVIYRNSSAAFAWACSNVSEA